MINLLSLYLLEATCLISLSKYDQSLLPDFDSAVVFIRNGSKKLRCAGGGTGGARGRQR